jgi:hypothetical protein
VLDRKLVPNVPSNSGLTIYPDPAIGNANTPYFRCVDQNMSSANEIPFSSTRAFLSCLAPAMPQSTLGASQVMPQYRNSNIHTDITSPVLENSTAVPGIGAGKFQEWDTAFDPILSNLQPDQPRSVDQLDAPSRVPQPQELVLGLEMPRGNGNRYARDSTQLAIHGQDIQQMEYNDQPLAPTYRQNQGESFASQGPSPNGYTPHILTETAYIAKVAERYKQNPDSDYPKDDQEAQLQIIKALFEAFRNTEDIIDKPQVALAFKDASIPDDEIEMVCWELMVLDI